MDPITLGLGAVSLISGLAGSRSAQRAAQTQAQAAQQASQAQIQAQREAIASQERMYGQGLQFGREALETQLGLQRPGLQAGQQALAALTGGLGLEAPRAVTGPGAEYGATQQQLTQAAGAMPGQFRQQFQYGDLYKDPSYQFRLNEGLRAIQASAAARGMGGQTMKDIVNYGQQAASQEYGSAYDRFMRNQQALYDRLSGLAGLSTTAAGASGQAAGQFAQGAQQAGTQFGTNIANLTTGGAQRASEYATTAAAASAAGQVGSTQAITGGVNQGLQNWMTLQYLSKVPQVASTRTPGGAMPTMPTFGQSMNLPGYTPNLGGFDFSQTQGLPGFNVPGFGS